MQVGFVEADNRDGAIQLLSSHDLFVLTVVDAGAIGIMDRINRFLNRVRGKDMVIFSRQLATLLEARLPLNSALKILYEQTANPILKESILEVTQDIDAGHY